MILRTFLILILLNCSAAFAQDYDADAENFQPWLESFSARARQQGISDTTVAEFTQNAEFLPRVIDLDRKQPDLKKTFDEYLKIVVPKRKIKEAKQKFEENRDLLEEIGEKYKVQPRFIVALWAIESDFGKNTGGFSVVNSLATLAYEGRRAEFFEKELINALKIIDQGNIDMPEMKGSWAGAMGQTQFMPSSYLELAVDYDGDGKKDIWGTRDDAFASIANYLSQRGWDNTSTWGREVKLPKNFDTKLIGKNIEKNIKEWQSLGVRKIDGGNLLLKHNIKAALIRPEDDNDRTYLVYYPNYKTILDWNRSLYFATAVGIIADGVGK
jgi:membrane-bound lytic murein transglycosylase B